MDDDKSLAASWSDFWYSNYKAAWDDGDFASANQVAFQGAIDASRRYRISDNIKDLLHRAILYSLASVAAEKVSHDKDFLAMYFMTKLTMQYLEAVPDTLADGYKVSLRSLYTQVDALGKIVLELGIDPNQEPMVFLKTMRAIDGY